MAIPKAWDSDDAVWDDLIWGDDDSEDTSTAGSLAEYYSQVTEQTTEEE